MPQQDLKPSTYSLTELQIKCLEGFWNRRSAKQIGADLGISEAWVNKNLMSARRKLHVNSSADAAAIVFGGTRGSIKTYYYQEEGGSLVLAASERPLINRYGPLTTIAGIAFVGVASIVGVALIIEAGEGLYQLLRALGY